MHFGEEVSFGWSSVVHQGRRVHMRAFPLPLPAGGIGVLFSNLGEVERLEGQERLQRSSLHHLLAELPGWAVFAYNADGTIVQWTDNAAELLGWSAAEITGHSIERLYDDDDRGSGRPWSEMSTARQNGRIESNVALIHRDGSLIGLRSIVIASADCPGHFLRIVSKETG